MVELSRPLSKALLFTLYSLLGQTIFVYVPVTPPFKILLHTSSELHTLSAYLTAAGCWRTHDVTGSPGVSGFPNTVAGEERPDGKGAFQSLSGSDILQFSPHSVHPELATERYYKGAGASLVAQMAKHLPAMQEDQSFTVPFFSLTNVVFFLQERN